MTTSTRSTLPDAIPDLSDEARQLIREAADQKDAQWDFDAARGLHDGDRFAVFYDDHEDCQKPYCDEPALALRRPDRRAEVRRLRDADGDAGPGRSTGAGSRRARSRDLRRPQGIRAPPRIPTEICRALPARGTGSCSLRRRESDGEERVWVLAHDLPETTWEGPQSSLRPRAFAGGGAVLRPWHHQPRRRR